jgi:hypothetical protein
VLRRRAFRRGKGRGFVGKKSLFWAKIRGNFRGAFFFVKTGSIFILSGLFTADKNNTSHSFCERIHV